MDNGKLEKLNQMSERIEKLKKLKEHLDSDRGRCVIEIIHVDENDTTLDVFEVNNICPTIAADLLAILKLTAKTNIDHLEEEFKNA